MYSAFRNFAERLLRIPPEPVSPPGDQSRTQIFRAAPNFYKYLLALWILKSILAFLFVFAAFVGPLSAGAIYLIKQRGSWAWLLMIIPVFVFILFIAERLFMLAVLRLDFEKRWYIVTDRSLRVREGIVIVREMTVTFANIQNISIAQGPIQRLLSISDLRVDTAGGGSQNEQHALYSLHTAWFRGIDNAPAVRELIQQRLRQWKDSGLGDHDEAHLSAVAEKETVLEALREVHAEAQALRQAVTA